MKRWLTKWKILIPMLLAGLVLAGVAMLALAELDEETAEPFLTHVDGHVQGDVHGATTSGLTRVMFGLTWIGSPKVLFPAIPVIVALLWWRRLRGDAVMLLLATVGAGILNTGLKLHFRRLRPDLPWSFVEERGYSFPSGHSVFAVVLYGMLVYVAIRHLRSTGAHAVVIVVAGVLILGIGFSRIYLGAHYPSDVAAGYFVGSIWLMAVIGANWWVERVGRGAGRAVLR